LTRIGWPILALLALASEAPLAPPADVEVALDEEGLPYAVVVEGDPDFEEDPQAASTMMAPTASTENAR
jgi:hypothetical protein